ncbi:MAG: adenylyl-sulfate kinase [Nitrososphaerales archaeon]
MRDAGTTIWFCGLPGSGKSTIARKVLEILNKKYDAKFEYVSMDQNRKKIFPEPKYDDPERDASYRSLILIVSFLSRNGINVILDGTGHKLVWRNLARVECKKFIEIYLKCPVELCIERETKRAGQDGIRRKLYADALQRLMTGQVFQGLGKVPGVDERFEESPNPELQVDSSGSLNVAVQEVLSKLKLVSPNIFNKMS